MRIYLFFTLLLCTTTLLYAQYDIVWECHIGEETYESAFDLIATSQANYLMAGYINVDDTNTRSAGYLVLVSEQGDVIWKMQYGVSERNKIYSAIEVVDGFVVAGFTLVGSTDSQAWLFKVNFDGELVWERTIGGDKYDYTNMVIQTNDGGYAMIGGSQNYCWNGIGIYEIQLFKLSSEGILEWEESYETTQSGVGTTLSQDADGNFIIGAESVNPLIQTSLLKTSPTGELLWRITYDDETTDNIITSVKVLPDGYVIGGGSGRDARVIKTDLDGSIVWKAYVGAGGFEKVNDFEITEQGHIICVGYSSSDSTGLATNNGRILLFELDADGQLLWRDTSFDSKFDFGMAMVSSQDGGLAVTGSYDSDSFEAYDLFVIKLQSKLSATTDPDPTPTLQLYPNPAHDQIVLTVESEDIGSAYSIYNGIGQVISKGRVSSRNHGIDIQLFPEGTYTLSLRNASGSQSHSFVKL